MKSIDTFVYWEGPIPAYIQRCLDSLRRTLSETTRFHLVNPHTLEHFVPRNMLHENFQTLTEPAHRADAIRAALLAVHGGFYFDADTVGLRSPVEVASNHDLVYSVWTNRPRRILNGYVYAQPGSFVARCWLEEINRRLSEMAAGEEVEGWTALGEGILTPLVDNVAAVGTTRQVPRTTFLPIDVDNNVRRLFDPGDPDEFIKPESVCFGLNHSWFWHNQREAMEMPVEQMIASPLLIHRLLSRT